LTENSTAAFGKMSTGSVYLRIRVENKPRTRNVKLPPTDPYHTAKSHTAKSTAQKKNQ